MEIAEVLAASGGRLSGRTGASFGRLVTNSRCVAGGDLFLALKGRRYDGNDFIDDAVSRGATAVICAAGRGLERPGVAFIEVDDTLRALGEIARAHRNRFQLPLVAITGTNGKTTTKEMLRAILSTAYPPPTVLANDGNLNNLIGLPMTLLELKPRHRVAVVEMGMNAPGEIARLTAIARPGLGLITCIGEGHLEGLGSLQGVAAAKGELFAGLAPDATAVVNVDDSLVVEAAKGFSGRRFDYGGAASLSADAIDCVSLDRSAFDLVFEDRRARVEMGLGGRHNVDNALGAAAAALALGVELETVSAGLGRVKPSAMRMAVERFDNGVTLVNDAYNANPSSVAAGLDTLSSAAGPRKIVVLGDMLELGAEASRLHAEAGRRAAACRPVLLCAVGGFADELCRGAVEAGMDERAAVVAADHRAAATAVTKVWKQGDTMLVKGSRGSRMEEIVELLREAATE